MGHLTLGHVVIAVFFARRYSGSRPSSSSGSRHDAPFASHPRDGEEKGSVLTSELYMDRPAF